MAAMLRVSLGGVSIAADGVGADHLPRFYPPFIESVSSSGNVLPVTVRIADPVPDGDLNLLADNEPGFSWYRSGSGLAAAKRDPIDSSRMLWRLDTGADAASAGLTVHPVLVDPPPGRSPTCPLAYPVDQILMMHHLALRRGAIHHAAGAVARGKLLLFPGRSRAGKTTITRLLLAHGGTELLSDDRIISRETQGAWRGFGTPWPGEAGVARNSSAPIGGIFFLRQSPEVRLERLDPAAALDRLLPVTSIPWFAPELLAPQLSSLRDLVEAVPCHDLHFRKDPSSAEAMARWIETNL